MLTLSINGKSYEVDVEPETPLLWVLRDTIGLTGTKYGCGEGECGACTIMVDGLSINSCLMFAADCDGREVVTIEGLASDPAADRLKKSFVEHGAVQCGFCTPGFLMLAVGVLEREPDISDDDLLDVLSSNLCRCTGYQNIVKAVRTAAKEMRK